MNCSKKWQSRPVWVKAPTADNSQPQGWNGTFHEWGTDLYETRESATSYSMGIVENDRGEIKLVNPENIVFLPETEPVIHNHFNSKCGPDHE